MYSKFLVPLAFSGLQLVSGQSLCDKYTTALLTQNTAANQYTLLQLIVNTVVIGNYTQPNVGVTVPGILAPANYGGESVNLLPYFNGCLASSNRGQPTAINFFDGGGAASVIDGSLLQKTTTRQYKLFVHLYEFFGTLLGCSQQGQAGFPAYDGQASMFEVHKYMGLDPNEVGYFISQVGAAAASFGVSAADIQTVASTLSSVFNVRCAPAVALVNGNSQLQSICVAQECPLAPNAVCSAYENNGVEPEPQAVNGPGCPVVSSSTSSYSTSYASTSTSSAPYVKPTNGWEDNGAGGHEGGAHGVENGGQGGGKGGEGAGHGSGSGSQGAYSGHGGQGGKPKGCPAKHHRRHL